MTEAGVSIQAEPSGRTQAARRSRSDRRLIAAALKLIAVKGADRTSMGEIGTAAGYSRALPSERFGSKIAMLEAIVDNMSDWFRHQVRAEQQSIRGLAAVRARVAAHLDAVTTAPEATRTLETLYVESLGPIPEMKPRMTAFSDELIRGLALHIEEAQQLGEIDRALDPVLFAETCLCTMRGVVLQSFFHEDPDRLKALRGQYLAILDSFLATHGPRAGKEKKT